MRFRFMDPNDPNDHPEMSFLLESAGEKGEADSPAGLVALLVGREYADVDDEEIAWRMRFESLMGHALILAGFFGRRVAIVDGSLEEPVWATDGSGPPEVELRVDGDYAMVASLQRAGLVRLYERGRVFRDPGSSPASCAECAFLCGDRCGQFDVPVGDPASSGCLDGVRRGAFNGAGTLEEVEAAELPPQRVKARQTGRVSA